MNLQNIGVSWVDIVVLLMLGFGLWRGRKRGMSEECLDIIKWVVTVLAAGLLYRPLGQLFQETTGLLGLLGSYVATYFVLVLIIAIIFSYIRRGPGEKLVGSDMFGTGEYYLGMLSGLGRYACIIIVAFAFLNARHYTAEDIKASEKFQMDNYGSDFFPTMPGLQRQVFAQSMSGRFVKEFMSLILIDSTAPGATGVKAREGSAP